MLAGLLRDEVEARLARELDLAPDAVFDPARAEAHYSLSFALFLQDRYEDAIARLKVAFSLVPRWGRLPELYDGGIALAIPGSPRLAADTCRSRLAQAPGDVSALLVLASLRAASPDPDLRNGAEAVQLAKRACAATRFQIPETLDVLAGAYAEAGRFDEAVRLGELTLWFARAAERTKLVPGAAGRLELYRKGQPFRRAD